VSNYRRDYSFPRNGGLAAARLRVPKNHGQRVSGEDMKKVSGLQGVLGLCCVLLSYGAWAQDEGAEEEAAVEEAPAEEAPAEEAPAEEAPAEEAPAEEAPAEEAEGESSSSANGNDRRFYLSPMFSYTKADDDRTTDDAMGGVISIGKKMTSGLNLELTGFLETMDREDETVTDDAAVLSGVGLAAMIFPSATLPNLYGILAVHQAEGKDHPTTPDAAGFKYESTVFDTGIGYLFPLNRLIGFDATLRAEARYRMDSHHRATAGVGDKDEFYEGVLNLGLLIPLGSLESAPAPEPEPEPAAPVEAPPSDTDGDGVTDDLDTCPDTPPGAAVDEKGCPPAPVEREGCRAPGAGEAINLEGCATGEAVVLKGVNFETGSSRLTANAKVILNQVADSLAAAPHLRVEIGGHTDAQGSDAFNLKLSDRRAQAAKDYLIARGIDAARLTSKGYGESQPVDTNETADGRELNRRVEMKVLEGGAGE
jgi:OOP family OmpA-OmpF porin